MITSTKKTVLQRKGANQNTASNANDNRNMPKITKKKILSRGDNNNKPENNSPRIFGYNPMINKKNKDEGYLDDDLDDIDNQEIYRRFIKKLVTTYDGPIIAAKIPSDATGDISNKVSQEKYDIYNYKPEDKNNQKKTNINSGNKPTIVNKYEKVDSSQKDKTGINTNKYNQNQVNNIDYQKQKEKEKKDRENRFNKQESKERPKVSSVTYGIRDKNVNSNYTTQKKTMDIGGQYNNVSTTFIVYSKKNVNINDIVDSCFIGVPRSENNDKSHYRSPNYNRNQNLNVPSSNKVFNTQNQNRYDRNNQAKINNERNKSNVASNNYGNQSNITKKTNVGSTYSKNIPANSSSSLRTNVNNNSQSGVGRGIRTNYQYQRGYKRK